MAFGEAEPCNRLRKYGGALFEPFGNTQDRLRESAPQPDLSCAKPKEPANRAENSKGHSKANMAVGPFAEKRLRPSERHKS